MGAMDKVKGFFGFGEEVEDEGIYDNSAAQEAQEQPEEAQPQTTFERTKIKSQNKPAISLHSNIQMKICIHEPLSYDESPLIVDDLRLRKAVVLNFEQLDMSVKRQIFDFVNGALYALDGKIQKVNKDIFILAPSNVEIEGLKEELKNKGVFPW